MDKYDMYLKKAYCHNSLSYMGITFDSFITTSLYWSLTNYLKTAPLDIGWVLGENFRRNII